MSKEVQDRIPNQDVLNAQQLIKIASEIGAKAALETLEKERQKAKKNRHDRRLRNTKLLLRNYRMLMSHCESAIYDKNHMNPEEHAADILDSIADNLHDEDLYVESIKRSAERTAVILSHTNEMLRLYEIYCGQSNRNEELRRYRTIHSLYIAERPKSIKDIAEEEFIDTRTVYKDIDSACEKLSALLFGVDGLNSR